MDIRVIRWSNQSFGSELVELHTNHTQPTPDQTWLNWRVMEFIRNIPLWVTFLFEGQNRGFDPFLRIILIFFIKS